MVCAGGLAQWHKLGKHQVWVWYPVPEKKFSGVGSTDTRTMGNNVSPWSLMIKVEWYHTLAPIWKPRSITLLKNKIKWKQSSYRPYTYAWPTDLSGTLCLPHLCLCPFLHILSVCVLSLCFPGLEIPPGSSSVSAPLYNVLSATKTGWEGHGPYNSCCEKHPMGVSGKTLSSCVSFLGRKNPSGSQEFGRTL